MCAFEVGEHLRRDARVYAVWSKPRVASRWMDKHVEAATATHLQSQRKRQNGNGSNRNLYARVGTATKKKAKYDMDGCGGWVVGGWVGGFKEAGGYGNGAITRQEVSMQPAAAFRSVKAAGASVDPAILVLCVAAYMVAGEGRLKGAAGGMSAT